MTIIIIGSNCDLYTTGLTSHPLLYVCTCIVHTFYLRNPIKHIITSTYIQIYKTQFTYHTEYSTGVANKEYQK